MHIKRTLIILKMLPLSIKQHTCQSNNILPPVFNLKSIGTMQLTSILSIALFNLSVVHAHVLAGRAVDGPCTGSGGAPGVCIATGSCTSAGGTYISGACPNDPADIKCCTKASCGSGGNCRWTSQCSSGKTQTGLCPGPADFKCCLPSSSQPPPPPPPASCPPWKIVEDGLLDDLYFSRDITKRLPAILIG